MGFLQSRPRLSLMNRFGGKGLSNFSEIASSPGVYEFSMEVHRWKLISGYTYRVVVPDLTYSAEIITLMYSGRAESENRIKELKKRLGFTCFYHIPAKIPNLRKAAVQDIRDKIAANTVGMQAP